MRHHNPVRCWGAIVMITFCFWLPVIWFFLFLDFLTESWTLLFWTLPGDCRTSRMNDLMFFFVELPFASRKFSWTTLYFALSNFTFFYSESACNVDVYVQYGNVCLYLANFMICSEGACNVSIATYAHCWHEYKIITQGFSRALLWAQELSAWFIQFAQLHQLI